MQNYLCPVRSLYAGAALTGRKPATISVYPKYFAKIILYRMTMA